MEIDVRPGLRLRPSISIGVAVSPFDGQSYEELLAVADRRMYDDKQRRRSTRGASSGSGPVGLVHSA
jgi:GGDEF domain-containing protein